MEKPEVTPITFRSPTHLKKRIDEYSSKTGLKKEAVYAMAFECFLREIDRNQKTA